MLHVVDEHFGYLTILPGATAPGPHGATPDHALHNPRPPQTPQLRPGPRPGLARL